MKGDVIDGQYIVVVKDSSAKGQSSFAASDVGGVNGYVSSMASSILSDSDISFGVKTVKISHILPHTVACTVTQLLGFSITTQHHSHLGTH